MMSLHTFLQTDDFKSHNYIQMLFCLRQKLQYIKYINNIQITMSMGQQYFSQTVHKI